ncbi:hypothetical protein OF829_01095 [Sphingomonas sp. LB-2]|uniref:hypothetical protein n=1 Tax=Sphingomonas caeni TaxID=2984949 RepID=UPI00222FF1EB|nr:hypothetical protein [Sphingomonas caeni]MCW3845818.1 hypothetical protein [Sphingomonas caeni]
METLRYGKGKLVGVALLCGLGAAFLLMLYLHPDWAAQSRKGRIFATGIGHGVLIPLIWIAFTVGATRAMMILVGDRVAVEAGSDALVLKTWWRTRRIAWADVGDASIVLTGTGKSQAWQLVVLHRDGNGSTEFKLPLATTELHQARYQEFVDSLLAMKARGGGGRVSASGQAAPASFDADAALARYMSKKAAGLIEAPDPAPARPVFGRKVV